MKKFILYCLFFLGCFTMTCSAQLIQNLSDMPVLEANKASYIDKPLSDLLADIRPEVKLFFTDAGIDSRGGTISFYFIDYSRFSMQYKNKKKPTRLLVTLEGYIIENDLQLPQETRFVWTPEDRLRNLNLIVKGLMVRGGED